MVQYVFTPWRDRRELLEARRRFYPWRFVEETSSVGTERDNTAAAVARVAMWVHRGHCPHMVESTALLAVAVLNDEAASEADAGAAGAAAGGYAVRAAYAAAFSRFVTGLLDGHQDAARKQSMYALARRLALPASFVELRHQATHEALPSLSRLRDAAAKALEWIWGYYWAHLGEDAEGEDDGEEGRCRRVLMGFLTAGHDDDGDEEARKEVVWRDLRRWDDVVVLQALADIGERTDDHALALRSVKLSREFLARRSTSGRVEVDAETPWAMDEDLEELQLQVLEERNVLLSKKGQRDDVLVRGSAPPSAERSSEDKGATGWSSYSGQWKAKPIGVV